MCLSVCVSVCVIRMDGQTACRIMTKIWEWITIYPRGNIEGSLLTQQSSKGSSTWSSTWQKFNRRASGDHVCLLVAPSSEFNINIERINNNIGRLLIVHLFRPLAGVWTFLDVLVLILDVC